MDDVTVDINKKNTSKRLRLLDLLRAFSVIGVTLNHFFGKPTGGFLGVDIFFVISGFIITLQLLTKYNPIFKSSNLKFFYLARVRKIIPPLLVTSVSVLILAFINKGYTALTWLSDLRYSLGFALNYHYIFNPTPYESQGVINASPVNHLWSLSVEEQFYLLWPLLLFALLVIWKKKILPLTISIFIFLTFSLFYWLTPLLFNTTSILYYDTFARVFQLLAGALVAIYINNFRSKPTPSKTDKPIGKNEAILADLSEIFLLIILTLIFILPTYLSTQSTSLGSLFVTLVVCLLLLSLNRPQAGPLMSFLDGKIIRFIGLRSYSFYLYHLPVLIFFKSQHLPLALGLALSFLLSILSYRFLELPILSKPTSTSFLKPLPIILLLALPLLLITTFPLQSLINTRLETLQASYVNPALVTSQTNDFCSLPSIHCHNNPTLSSTNASFWSCIEDEADLKYRDNCVLYAPKDYKYTIALMGDSVSKSYLPGLVLAAKANNWRVISATAYGCGWWDVDPVISKLNFNAVEKNCLTQVSASLKYALSFKPDLTIISNNSSNRYIQDPWNQSSKDGSRKEETLKAGKVTLKTLLAQHSKILLVEPPLNLESKTCASPIEPTDHCNTDVTLTQSQTYRVRQHELYQEFQGYSPEFTSLLDSLEATCYPDLPRCSWETPFGPSRTSQIHLTFWMSFHFSPTLAQAVNQALGEPT